jgi:gamma-butyrobetaine dioxygenase
MLQTATVAQSQGAPDAVVAAALLHDIGYFLLPESEASVQEGRNTEHEALGATWLSRHFGPDVTAPVALHVEAKRYLCATEPGYFEQLSDASRASLMVQGGIMSEREAAAFAKQAGSEAAVILRRADDLGKDPSMQTPPLEHFRALLTGSLK